MPTLFLDIVLLAARLSSMTVAASVYGIIISGIFIANSGRRSGAGRKQAIAGSGTGSVSIEV